MGRAGAVAGRDAVPAAQEGGESREEVRRLKRAIELKAQEIFAIGEWNEISFTEADIDSIVSSFEALGLTGHVPLKLGHEGPDARDEPASQFALGWVQRVYREGKKLLADFDVPEKVASWIKEGFLRFVSVELLKDVKASTREIPWVLDAVALLGADQPAVGILKSLSLTMARSTALQCRERVAFSRDNPTTGGHRPTMADEPNKDIAAILTRLSALEEENKSLKLSAAESETNKRLFTELQQKTHGEKVAAHRTALLALFETAIKEKKILPAVRERFKRAYPVDKDDVLNIPLTDVETFIRENPNPDAPKAMASMAGGDHAPVDALADTQALCAARKFVRENPEFSKMPRWEQLTKAGVALFRADPELGRSYQRLPETVNARAE